MERSTSTTEKWWAYLFAISIFGIAVITVALSEAKELPLTIIGALLGVAMTVFATYFLFKGQSKQQVALIDQQREQEKDVEVFKQKLKSYNAFLDSLRRYVTDPNVITKKDVIFNAMAIRMHCGASIIDSLDENITTIIKTTGDDNDKEARSLVMSLNKIACLFREELYGESLCENSEKLKKFEKAVAGSTEEPTEEQKLKESQEDEQEDKEIASKSIPDWEDKIAELKTKAWNLATGDDSFRLSSASSPIVISVYRKKGKYVIEAAKGDDSEFSQALKNEFKGARRYGTWWRELPINNYGVTAGSLLSQLPTNARARASVIKWIDKLINFHSAQK